MFGPGSDVLEQVIRRKLESKLEKFDEEKGRRVSRNKRGRENPRLTHGSGLVRTSLLNCGGTQSQSLNSSSFSYAPIFLYF